MKTTIRQLNDSALPSDPALLIANDSTGPALRLNNQGSGAAMDIVDATGTTIFAIDKTGVVTQQGESAGLVTSQGLIGQNFDRAIAQAGSLLTGGTAYGTLIPLKKGQVVTNIVTHVTTGGTATSHVSQGIYSQDGVTRFALTGDSGADQTAFNTTGAKAVALTAPWTVPATGAYLVITVLTAGTTVPTLLRASNVPVAALGANALPFSTGGTGLTAVPAGGATLVATNALALWYGVS